MNKFLFIFGVLSSLITAALATITIIFMLDPWTPKRVLAILIIATIGCAICSVFFFMNHRQVPVVTKQEIDRILAAIDDDNAPVLELVNQ